MWWMILLCLSFFLLGILIGIKIPRDSAQIASLRKRGYFLRESESDYDWRWVHLGFNKEARPVEIKGPWCATKTDAIANAEAHYYATIKAAQDTLP